MSRSALLLGILLAAAACSEDPPSNATVAATPELRFVPNDVDVRAGGSVTWEFGAVPHNVFFTTGPSRPADIEGLNQETTVSRTFAGAGIYEYECRLHPGMRGRVVVNQSGGTGSY